jgi:hypothetical protein
MTFAFTLAFQPTQAMTALLQTVQNEAQRQVSDARALSQDAVESKTFLWPLRVSYVLSRLSSLFLWSELSF